MSLYQEIRLPPSIAQCLFRVTQEGIRNAHARRVNVSLRIIDMQVTLHIIDEVGSGDDALLRCQALQPDILVLDLSMPAHRRPTCSAWCGARARRSKS
jgi:DNA-binding NarL/FixJ family response regulator